jgi:hypothetical protein
MKYLKAFELVALVAAALTAVVGVGTASATELTCTEPAGTKVMCPVGTEVHAEAEGNLVTHQSIGDIPCSASTMKGKTTNTGGSSETVAIVLEALTFSGCNAEVVVLEPGSLEIHTREASANGNGTVTWSGMRVTQTFVGFHCIFTTSATDIGTLTGSSTTKATPTLDIEATIPRTGGRSGAFCGSTAQWTGSYQFTAPDWMDVD